jgi:diaminohydroxyphosphoribosylaminopyrimidine deaminase/5-amino-6-(5-phosphoribosylamino)uracil reductase
MCDISAMRLAIRLARRGYGATSPNPMVGAVVLKDGQIIGRGWHHRAGGPHAEIEALRDAQNQGHSPRGATLYVTLEPCCTQGRTPPCTDAIMAAGIKRVVAGTTDPNPLHAGNGFRILRRAGLEVELLPTSGGNAPASRMAGECARLNEAFNHWIVHHTPLVTVKAAMTLDGKIATAAGESKWITGAAARQAGMKLRQGSDAILVGIKTILADDPALTTRLPETRTPSGPRRLILDSLARTPLSAQVVSDEWSGLTTLFVSPQAPSKRVAALRKKVEVVIAPPSRRGNTPAAIPLRWLLNRLGKEKVTSVLVEGGGEINASFLLAGLAQRVAFFYAPKILGGRDARKGVAGEGARSLRELIRLEEVEWQALGDDLFLRARIQP